MPTILHDSGRLFRVSLGTGGNYQEVIIQDASIFYQLDPVVFRLDDLDR